MAPLEGDRRKVCERRQQSMDARVRAELAFKESEEVLRQANDELEKRVLERTRALEDANARLQLEKERAEEATRLKDQFVSLVAHDLRSPLSSIFGLLEFIASDENHPLSAGQKALVEEILSSGRNLTEMVENILNIGRLKTGKISPKKSFLDGRCLVDGILRRISHPIALKHLSVENTIPINTRLFGDSVLLGTVVQNLLTNALKFSYPGTRIEVFLTEGERSIISVRDCGVGIPVELQSKLFCVAEKVSTPGTAGERGTGFGLPFSHDIIAAHDGQLEVASIPGKGSTFSICLPKVRPQILLVDDQEMDRMLLATVLARLDLDIIEAGNGRTALKLLQEYAPHLIVSDVTMPGMSGFELLKQVKETPGIDTIPVILITGDEKVETRDQAFRLGAADFTIKPIVIHDFLPRVRHQLGEC